MGGGDFLVGGSSSCDLRLPASNLPPIVCQISRTPAGVRIRRLTPVLAVLLNGVALPANSATAVNSGDILSLGEIEITFAMPQAQPVIVPKFVPLDIEPATQSTHSPSGKAGAHGQRDERRSIAAEDEARNEEWKRRDAELIRRARELDLQTEELESDRILWYRRRQEIEQELEHQRTAIGLAGIQKADLEARERELNRLKDELSVLRERLLQEYQERRNELARQAEKLRDAGAQLRADREGFEAQRNERSSDVETALTFQRQKLDIEAARRRDLMDEEIRQRRTTFEAELATMASRGEADALHRYREQFAEVERLRAAAYDELEKARAEAAEIKRRAEDDVERHRTEVAKELDHYEPRLRDIQEKNSGLAAAMQDLARQRDLFAADREVFDRARATFETQQAAETERLMTWENTLVDRSAELTRGQNELKDERAALDRDRIQFQEDLVRLERRISAADEKEHAADVRLREAEVRLEQLRRDAAEWEETVRLAATEQDRLRAESERLDRQKAELDAQSAALTERAGELEAQQAVLAIQRAKLDRARQEMERDTAQMIAARTREDEALAELRLRIREAEELRAQLTSVQEDAEQERRRLEERDSLLSGGLEEIRSQREALALEAERIRLKEEELDSRAAEFAEQAGTLKGRLAQALELQARLEADRVTIREREAALAQAEETRAALQEQLRRRAEDLAARSSALDELARQVEADRAAIEETRASIDLSRQRVDGQFAERQREVEERAARAERMGTEYSEKEQALARQAAKLKDVGIAVAAERKALAETRAKWEAERAEAIEADRRWRDELESFREQAAAELAALRGQAPELEAQSRAALDRLAAARDMLRGHLTELHDYARVSRDDLEAIRAQVREEADRLREREEQLNRAKAEHRLAVSAFRQQLIEWQGQVAEMKRTLTQSESRLDARQAAVDEAAKQVDETTHQLAEQAEQLRRERDAVALRRGEVERHLAEMREWYRKKLRELAKSHPEADRAVLKIHGTPASSGQAPRDDLEPGDKQLGELLRAHELVDADTLNALWAEAGRQRRTLRQVLLASGAITLYQLALIEAGNLDALVLDRFRVIDRLRSTPREVIYRVFDPRRTPARSTGEGIYLLRHLAEGEMQDALHPDEFRQRFAAARDAAHPNLATVAEVLEIAGRPAVVQEWPTGLYSADWPPHAAHPGCWVRLISMAAAGIDAAHRQGLVHGRLTSDSFVLTPAGALKVTGFGEPPWLTVGPTSSVEPTPAADLRALGQVAFGWSLLAGRRKGAAKPKPFPEALLAIIRRLEADPEPPMADTVATGKPYGSAAELVADLDRVARETPFSDDAWDKLLKHVADNAPESGETLKRSA